MFKPLSKKIIKELNKKTSEDLNSEVSLVFLLQDVTDPINVGSIFRIAEALNAKLILTNNSPTPPNKGISMTSRGLERRVEWEYSEKAEDAVDKLKQDGFKIIAVELTEDSVSYSKFEYGNKVCLVLGNEAKGVYKKILEVCDAAVHIPMLGKGPSLNVNVAAAVVGYESVRS